MLSAHVQQQCQAELRHIEKNERRLFVSTVLSKNVFITISRLMFYFECVQTQMENERERENL